MKIVPLPPNGVWTKMNMSTKCNLLSIKPHQVLEGPHHGAKVPGPIISAYAPSRYTSTYMSVCFHEEKIYIQKTEKQNYSSKGFGM